MVAASLPGREPRLVRLEAATDHMPSYFALGPDGQYLFGSEAANVVDPIHGIKLLLPDDRPIPELGGMRPTEIATLMLAEVVRRTLRQLRSEGLLPAEADLLEVATNLGCTPMFQLQARLRLRDAAISAGLNVRLASLVDEPVAAALEIVETGIAHDGRVLVVDMGGGTLDVAVVRIVGGARRFELFASGGYERGGDKFTDVIRDELRRQVTQRLGHAVLSRRDEHLLWQRAEAAKLALSVRQTVTVDLAGVAGLSNVAHELSRQWFKKASGALMVFAQEDVTNVYRVARLILDRGGEDDPAPGTIRFRRLPTGGSEYLTQVELDDDGREHIDWVVLVGGATHMPMVSTYFRGVFGDRVVEPELTGRDRAALVALGLARGKPAEAISLQYPNWGISALFRGPFSDGAADREIPLYEPFAAAFVVRDGETGQYRAEVEVPAGSTAVALGFRPVGGTEGRLSSFKPLSAGTQKLTFRLDLFGRIWVTTDAGNNVFTPGDILVPWHVDEAGRLEWIPGWRVPRAGCVHGARPGKCIYLYCSHHPTGGFTFDDD